MDYFSRNSLQICCFQQFFSKKNFFSKNPPVFFPEKPNFRKFRDCLLIESYSTAILMLLSIFLEKSFCLQKTHFFITPNFRTFWRFLLIQWHSTANLLFLTILKKINFSENLSDFFSIKQNLNVLRKLTNSVAFYSKFATFITFLKNRILFEKTNPFLKENIQFSKVLRLCIFSVAL